MKEQKQTLSEPERDPWWRRNKAALVILLILVGTFAAMFWMIGQAAYNQSVPR
jgi:hypothetical protein